MEDASPGGSLRRGTWFDFQPPSAYGMLAVVVQAEQPAALQVRMR